MSQLETLRKIEARIPGVKFIKLELCEDAPEDYSEIVVFLGQQVFAFGVTDKEWINPEPLIDQVVKHVKVHYER